MTTAYVAVTVVAALALACAAILSFTHAQLVADAARRVHVPETWMLPLGMLLAAGAFGLVAGFAIPWVGTAAAVGVVLYFLCAVGAHLRVRDPQLGPAAVFLLLAVVALSTRLLEGAV